MCLNSGWNASQRKNLMANMSNAKTQNQSGETYESALFLLDDRHNRERQNRLTQSLITSWPIGVGILLALIAPMLSDIVSVFKPWGMWLVFPFVELCARPELHFGSDFQRMAPQIMLFLQFPLEGLMAKKFLKGRVTLSAVAGQILIYHVLGATQLWLVWRTLGSGIIR
jgi:hypothetical protein